jgi:DNA-binding transcriptional LysR family regulator
MEQKNISADDLILFATIVEQQSLIRAAENLSMPKATVSRRLTNLEELLGQRLLLRTTRRLTLTDFGQEFLEHCRRVAEEVATVQDFVRSQDAQPRGRLRISLPDDYARQRLSRAIATFVETYPEVQIDLDLSSRRVDLIGERFDLAIRMGELDDDSNLVARKIDEHKFSMYTSPIYLALHPMPQHPDDLMQHTSVRMLTTNGTPIPWKLTKGKEIWENVPPGRLGMNSPNVIHQLLLDGAGIGTLPERAVTEDLRLNRLVRVLPEWNLPVISAWAVMPMRRYLPSKTRVFLSHIEHYLKA